jgi:hypothetical protein
MNEVLYRLPDCGRLVTAFVLCEVEGQAFLFVPPVENLRGATLTIADRKNGDPVFEDSPTSSFPLRDWGTVAAIAIFLMLILKDDLIDEPTKLER